MDSDVVIRKTRGKDRQPRKRRTDRDVITQDGDNARFIVHDMKLTKLPHIDVNDPVAMQERIDQYFLICAEDDVKPSVASLALAFGISRFVLFDWINGRSQGIKNAESLHTLKGAYNMINSYYEHLMNNGKINPVSGIFLMKNNLGYKDTTDYIITANQDNTLSIGDIADRAGLLDE